MLNRSIFRVLALFAWLAVALSAPAGATTILSENFDDGGGVNSVFNFTNTNGTPPGLIGGGPSGTFARITHLTTSNNNSLAFDHVPQAPGSEVIVSMDFRMSTDATTLASGGLAEAADGLGIGFFETTTYGLTGALNPAVGGVWEDPSVGAGFLNAVVLGLDIWAANNARITGLGGSADLLGDAVVPFQLNNNVFHRAQMSLVDDGADALVSLTLIEDILGAAIVHPIFMDLVASGLDLDGFSGRLILGGRTGGSFVLGDVDNIGITSGAHVPESSATLLLGLGLLVGWRSLRRGNTHA